jgi:hypothetical protein
MISHGDAGSGWRQKNILASFPPDELHWAVAGWARVAPGGWIVLVPDEASDLGHAVLVAPPSPAPDRMSGPKYIIAATIDGQAILFADIPGNPLAQLATFTCLSDALHHLCPLTPVQDNEADALAEAANPQSPNP